MAVGKKNSGFFKQDAVAARMLADAKRPQQLNAAVVQAMKQAERNRLYREAQLAKQKPRFIR
ncbi:MAG: hypothetical protein EBS34_13050 [Flavobacteriales bacterium]|nr:hypothetical protein [Flavobacteriales bacterium]